MKSKKEKTRPKINLARVYSFYVSQKSESWNFKVTVKCHSPLCKETGMSVDLVNLDRLAKSIFKNEVSTSNSLISVLEKKVSQIKVQLQKQPQSKKTNLVTVHFDEVRQFGIHFLENQVLFVRQDMAKSQAGDLFEVISYLDSDQSVVKLKLKNFKTKVIEQIIF